MKEIEGETLQEPDDVEKEANFSNQSNKRKKSKKSKKKNKPENQQKSSESDLLTEDSLLAANINGLDLDAKSIDEINDLNPIPPQFRKENIMDKLTELPDFLDSDIIFANYVDESFLPQIQSLVARDLSEPYSVFTYRYFLQNWPELCVCAFLKSEDGSYKDLVGAIICKAELEQEAFIRGYIAMLAVDKTQRKKGIGSKLAHIGIKRMMAMGCDEVSLETEASNVGALNLYQKLGFVRDERLARYYLNGGDAFRLKLWMDKRDL